MHITANVTYGESLVGSLARPVVEERRNVNRDARSSARLISGKAAPTVSSGDSDVLSEAEAIIRARHGDRSAFEYLYRLHSRRVYGICLRIVGNTTEAEDLAQEVFLLVLRKIHTFRGESAFSTWLHRLAVNLVFMHLRKKSPLTVPIETSPGLDDEGAAAGIDFGTRDLLLEGSLDRINLERCFQQLPAGCRRVFVLHDVHGYQHNEIAAILGRTAGDSKSQLHKARMRLREQLQELQRDQARTERLAEAKLLSQSSEG